MSSDVLPALGVERDGPLSSLFVRGVLASTPEGHGRMISTVTAPHVEEQRNDPRARAEGRDAVSQLADTHLANLIEWQKKEAEAATKRLREDWAYWWDLWLNNVSFEGKEDWQTQVWVPKPSAAIEQATALIHRSLLDAPEPFRIDGEGDPRSKKLAMNVWNPLVRLAFEQANFIGKYADSCKVGFITGVAGYQKFRWQNTRTPYLVAAALDPATGRVVPQFAHRSRGFLAIDYVEPWKIFRDPESRARENFSGTYLIHDEWKNRAFLHGMRRVWDQDAIQRLLDRGAGGPLSTAGMTNTQEEEARRKQERHEPNPLRKPVLVSEWWGDILNEHGDPVMPDALMTASGRDILLKPVDNPLWATDRSSGRRKWPFLAAAPLVHPTRFEGRGIAEQNADLSRLFSGTLCLMADGMNWMVNPETEVWQDALVDFTDLGHYPGKLWIKKSQPQALMQAQSHRMVVGEVMAFLNWVAQLAKESDFVTDFAAGLPGSRSQITLGETEIKTAQSLAVFEMMSRNLEHGGREAVELTKDILAQHLSDFMDPEILGILGPDNAMLLASMPLHERINELQGNFTYSFTGLSGAMKKADQLNKIVQFGQLAASRPYVDLLAQQTPQVFVQILRTLRDTLGLGDRITLPEEQAMTPMMGAPGMPGAVPGALPGPGMPAMPGGGGAPAGPGALLAAYEANGAAAGAAARGPAGAEGGM